MAGLIYAASVCVTMGCITIPFVLPYSWGSMLHKLLAVLQ